ncbi:Aminopeptidase [Fulvivirga imtechensis AK7]|uniref:Carboxypeptidase Q n=1 Tax=Fulvivirga imtechensis AK7 TaxID=1237149 RepID=L8JVN3_9BACT|nr:M28 family peptidase [Fulvivirga imtechensis]ELR72233.1 Aminopeptidase [Fulvivirga imtechensis AK7]
MKIKTLLFLYLAATLPNYTFSQSEDEAMLRKTFNEALTNGQSYQMLDYLSNNIGARLSGSPEAAAAVEWSRQQMMRLGFDTVYLQEVMVPHWVRGKKEVARIVNAKSGTIDLKVCALGNSVGTGPDGLAASVVEVKNFDELKNLGRKNVEGKIVFYNRPMDPTLINTFGAYGGAVDQRVNGPSEAARLGAKGVIVRSMASNNDDIPHTGTLVYDESAGRIPAIAVSTNDANLLSRLLKDDANLKVYMETHCEMLPDVLSYNVIGEMKGNRYPNEYIVVGGHLDSWDVGDGSHDDGAGCVQSIEAIRILMTLGYKPQRTLRAVMFMNEENGLRGGLKYAAQATANKETHIAAIESDRGGFTPKGFTISGSEKAKSALMSWKPLFAPYDIYDFGKPGGGADIGPLGESGTALIGFLPDSQRYFTLHHTDADTFETVDKRELEMGAGSMAALVYLIDKYGMDGKN